MRENSRQSNQAKSNIQCIEILISRRYVHDSNQNLFWTLSVYSLENQPVRRNRSLYNSEIFHFMVYDWQRTIKKLLEEKKIPYSIVQYFSPDSIHVDAGDEPFSSLDNEGKILAAISDLSELSETPVDRSHNFMLNEKLS